MMHDGQHVQAGAVGAVVAAVNSFGLLDWAGPLAVKAFVALLLAAVSGFGYQLGRALWRRLGGRGEP